MKFISRGEKTERLIKVTRLRHALLVGQGNFFFSKRETVNVLRAQRNVFFLFTLEKTEMFTETGSLR